MTTHSPAPDTSADWGYSNHDVLDTGGSGVGKASEPADPMHFVPNAGAPIDGSPDPVPGDINAPLGYPSHGMELTNP